MKLDSQTKMELRCWVTFKREESITGQNIFTGLFEFKDALQHVGISFNDFSNWFENECRGFDLWFYCEN